MIDRTKDTMKASQHDQSDLLRIHSIVSNGNRYAVGFRLEIESATAQNGPMANDQCTCDLYRYIVIVKTYVSCAAPLQLNSANHRRGYIISLGSSIGP